MPRLKRVELSCGHELTHREILSVAAAINAGKRKDFNGPAKKPTACKRCGVMCDSAREAWNHKCER